MNVISLFRRLVFAQVLLGVVAFCMAEENPGMMLIAGTIGVLSWYVVEGPTGRPLPQWLIHLGAVGAVMWLIMEIFRVRTITGADANRPMIIAMGHFTMWLQVLQLYGKKGNREYALILVLGLMQMVGASTISYSMVYGVLLGAYCIVAMFTILLFQFKSLSDMVLEHTQKGAPEKDRVKRAQPVAGRNARWHFRGMALFIGAFCGVTATVVFVLMPRHPDQAIKGLSGPGTQQTVGFNDHVQLGGGSISSGSDAAVAKLVLRRDGQEVTDESIGLLLRGAALDHYSFRTHTWERRQPSRLMERTIRLDPQDETGFDLAMEVPNGPVLEADITLREVSRGVLFSFFPPTHIQSDMIAALNFSPVDQQMMLAGRRSGTGGALSYTIRSIENSATPALMQSYERTASRFTAMDPDMGSAAAEFGGIENPWYREGRPYRRRRWEDHQRVQRHAKALIESAELTRDYEAETDPNDAAIVQVFLTYLQNPANFQYSLDNPPALDGEDPTESFMFTHRRGHCELFASALAAMCRSVGIESRVITGYRVSEYNSVGGYYVVRQNNAHAWNEVFLGDEGWSTIDPTPPGDLADEHDRHRGLLSGLRDFYEHVEFLWLSSFVTYDQNTRQKLLGDIEESFNEAADDDEAWFGQVVDFFKSIPEMFAIDRANELAISVICLFIFLALITLARILVIRHRRLAALRISGLSDEKRKGMTKRLRFYLLMLDMLERNGFRRPQWQSPRQFAEDLAREQPTKFESVVALTDLFYEIRFGHRDLDESRRRRVREQLKRLEDALAGRTDDVAQPVH